MLNFIAISIVLFIYLTVSVGGPILEVQGTYGCSWKFASVRAIPAIIGVQVLMSIMNPYLLGWVGERVDMGEMPEVYVGWVVIAIMACTAGIMWSTRPMPACTVCEGRVSEWDSEMCYICENSK